MNSHLLSVQRTFGRPHFDCPMATQHQKRQPKKKVPASTKLKPRNNSGERKRSRDKDPPSEVGQEAAGIRDIEDIVMFSKEEVNSIRRLLLEWYDVNQRDLPWRKRDSEKGEEEGEEGEEERRAYGVWVSEVMLQQTRVQTVIDYYNRWMHKWPSLHHLASASLEEMNEMWAGLGYYRRARFLLEGAKMIVEGGEGFPRTVAALLKVPGIGDYTAGAIASIAFKEVVPVVDGNVMRVLARLKAVSANPKNSATIKTFWRFAGQLVDDNRPGDFNQSLMELGATICTPLNPNCSSCPISRQCRALSISKEDKSVAVTDFPVRAVKTKQRHEFSAVCVVEILRGKDTSEENQSDNAFLLVKRPDEGLLAGLWEFPSVMVKKEADLTTRRKAVDQFLKKSFGLDTREGSIVLREDIGEFVHIFTHIRLKICAELLVLRLKDEARFFEKQCNEKNSAWKFVDGNALSNMGLTSAVRKVYTMVQEFKQKNISSQTPRNGRKRRLPA